MKQNQTNVQAMLAFLLWMLWSRVVGAVSSRGVSPSAQEKDSEAPTWQAMVINLDRRPDRLKRFSEAIQEYEPWISEGGHLCRIKGRDGRELPLGEAGTGSNKKLVNVQLDMDHDDADVTRKRIPDGLSDDKALLTGSWVDPVALHTAETQNADWPDMTPGGIGLYLGHAAAWQHVLEKNLDYGVIFEDDLTLFAGNFAEQVQSILQTGPGAEEWDFLYLQRCDDEAWKKRRTSGKDADPIKEQASWSREVKVPHSESVPCTGAYVVTQAGARTLMQQALPAHEQLDHQLASVTDLRRSALTPPVAQCQEIVKNGSWTYRDTDVQQTDENLNLNQSPQDLQNFLGIGIWSKVAAKSFGFLQNGVRSKSEFVVDCS